VKSIMWKETKILRTTLAVAVLATSGAMVGTTVAQNASVPLVQDKLAIGEPQVKQLLLLMDTDKNGKISKQEYMRFMEAEFDRLDKNKSGDLDVKELTRSQFVASHPVYVGK
jgi:EF hand